MVGSAPSLLPHCLDLQPNLWPKLESSVLPGCLQRPPCGCENQAFLKKKGEAGTMRVDERVSMGVLGGQCVPLCI